MSLQWVAGHRHALIQMTIELCMDSFNEKCWEYTMFSSLLFTEVLALKFVSDDLLYFVEQATVIWYDQVMLEDLKITNCKIKFQRSRKE